MTGTLALWLADLLGRAYFVIATRTFQAPSLLARTSEGIFRPMQLIARHRDPVLDNIARSVYALFPRCVRCGELVACFDDADVRILANRVVHRGACQPGVHGEVQSAAPTAPMIEPALPSR